MKRLILIGLLLLAMALELLTGEGFGLPSALILWKLRLPRMVTALLSGGMLALSGAQLQALFRNPLADPHIMGVSGGAGLGAAIAALALGGTAGWLGGLSLAAAAFAGALLTSFLVVAIAARVPSTGTLLVAGVMLGFILSAVSSILQYSAGEESLKLFYSWMAGSFSTTPASGLGLMAAALLPGAALALGSWRELDLALFGDAYASALGVSAKGLRFRVMLGCALMTGAVTAFCGPIGFVGIVAPHLTRRFLGTAGHRAVLPWSMVTGGILALLADVLAHLGPTPLPVGSTLAIIGIPFIVIMLWRSGR